MKNILATLIALVLMLSCSSDSYTINGTIDETNNGEMIYLADINLRHKLIDSTIIENGKFSFTGTFDSPTIISIFIPYRYTGHILTENTDITIDIKKGELNIASSEDLNGEFNKMNQQISAMNKNNENLIDSLWKTQSKEAKLKQIIKDIRDKHKLSKQSYMLTVLESNNDNMLGVYCLSSVMDNMSLIQMDSLLQIVPLAKDYEPVMWTYRNMKMAEATAVGARFVDFYGENIDGTPAKLSDYVGKGKYVLVDFWASWCRPCMQENPNLKYLHENYPELVVLGINVWDDNESFHSSIKEENMTWNLLYASDNEDATDMYGIQGIPSIILFDPTGVIVDRTLRGEAMKEKIATIFKK